MDAPHLAMEGVVPLLLLDLVIIVAVARLSSAAFAWIGQPPVVGEILGGIVLGPSLLGALYPDALHTLFLDQTAGALAVLGQIGLVLLMLLMGLEFPFEKLGHAMRPAVAVAGAGAAVPFVASFALAGWLHGIDPRAGPMASYRLFFATAVSITAIPVMGRILLHLRLTRTRIGLCAITAAAIDDIVGWLLLGSIVASTLHGSFNLPSLAASVAGIGALGTAFWILGRRVIARLTVPTMPSGRLPPAALAAVLAAVFLTGSATHALGVFALFGGFLCGLAASFNHKLADAIRASLEDVVSVLLLPIFFVLSGLRTDIGTLGGDPAPWIALLAVIGVSCASMLLATTVAARASGLPWRESVSVGLLMNTRGLMALVVINIGADLGIIGPATFFWLVAMALMTSVMATPLLRRIVPRDVVWDVLPGRAATART